VNIKNTKSKQKTIYTKLSKQDQREEEEEEEMKLKFCCLQCKLLEM
jgi:hypothetical protein